ncbi:hypothetical protein BU52_32215 [Streptomyces toyocaensis]|uniref:Uncharacterized protein n=1 Tax=Streptomyces toyocaensis TaxID=55952 RepID=A0A081XHU6_STRTO|nr:hypothetical protein [Streptomyces toyocaensis]KES03119.1 hypothetical protein BU52_32215 [Streptomyces toyocaensis]
MSHTDPYSLTAAGSQEGTPDRSSSTGAVRVLLWVVLVVSVLGNTVASFAGAGLEVHLAAGGVTALCATVLVVLRLRSGR